MNTERQTGYITKCMFACVSCCFIPRAQGLLGLVASILSLSPTATQLLSLGVTTQTHTTAVVSLCRLFIVFTA